MVQNEKWADEFDNKFNETYFAELATEAHYGDLAPNAIKQFIKQTIARETARARAEEAERCNLHAATAQKKERERILAAARERSFTEQGIRFIGFNILRHIINHSEQI